MTLSHHLPSYPKKALLCPPSTPSSLSTRGFSPSLKDVPKVAEPLVGPQGHRLSPSRSQSNHQVALQLHQVLLAAGAPAGPVFPEGPSGPPSGNTCIGSFVLGTPEKRSCLWRLGPARRALAPQVPGASHRAGVLSKGQKTRKEAELEPESQERSRQRGAVL